METVDNLESVRKILQFEADNGKLKDHHPNAETNTSSQYELLKNIFSKSAPMGNYIIDIHMFKHPLAMEKQRQLFAVQPGLFPFLMAVVLEGNHPLKQLDEYLTLLNLMDGGYPTIFATEEEVKEWGEKLDIALARFMDYTLLCASYALDIRESSDKTMPRLIGRLQSQLFHPSLLTTPLINSGRTPISVFQMEDKMGKLVQKLGEVHIHGIVRPDQERFIQELGKAHKFFLARKIAIMKNIEPNPKFTLGLINELHKVKDYPAIFIGYRLDGDPATNDPYIGVDFNNLHPVVCVYENCMENNSCQLSSGAHEHFYIKTSTVHVGEPPLGAQRCVNFEAMKKAWEFKAKSQCYHLPAVFDPVARANPQLRKKYKRRKGTTNNENQYVWEERYLRFVHKEFKEKNSADNEMIARHMIEKASGEEGSDGELNFQFHVAPTFFLPGVYKMLC